MSLLAVQQWRVVFESDSSDIVVIDEAHLELKKGQTTGLVGESGSGKSILGLSLMGLLPRGAVIRSGKMQWQGEDISYHNAKSMQKLRGQKIAMIFQDPSSSLNPSFTVGFQLLETIKTHRPGNSEQMYERALELLKLVGIPDPEARMDSYPHHLSGGMAQRVMIAMALACEASLLIADEPTTALDVTIQAQILQLLKDIQEQTGLAILLISHDMGVVAQNCDWLNVLYCGKIVESGPAQDIILNPRHPYTQDLIKCLPINYAHYKNEALALPTIPGQVPALKDRPSGCVYRTRCSLAQEICQSPPPIVQITEQHRALCYFADQTSTDNG